MESQLPQSALSFFLYLFLSERCFSSVLRYPVQGCISEAAAWAPPPVHHRSDTWTTVQPVDLSCMWTVGGRPRHGHDEQMPEGKVLAECQHRGSSPVHPSTFNWIYSIHISRLRLPISSWIQPFPSVCGWHLSCDELDMSQPSSTAQCRGCLVWTVLCLFCPFEVLLCLSKCCLNAASSCVRAGGLDIGQSHSREVWKPEPPSLSHLGAISSVQTSNINSILMSGLVKESTDLC